MPIPKRLRMRRGVVITRTETPAESSGFMLWRASYAWQREMRRVLDAHGITLVQFVLLTTCWWLNEIGDEPTQREMASHAGVDVMMTSQVVRRLEADGFVTRTTSVRDPRALSVTPTAAGLETLTAALADVQANDEVFFGELGQDEPAFRDALRTLTRDDQRAGTAGRGAAD